MFDDKDLKRAHCVTTAEKLLWNLCENLKAARVDIAGLAEGLARMKAGLWAGPAEEPKPQARAGANQK